jgi:phosphoribosyl 1,2-cyclic phosphodiesterase
MTLDVIKTGSKGNSYILKDETFLLLEAGVSLSTVKKHIDFQLEKVEGMLVTHEHLDHFKYVKQYADAGITVCSAKETFTEYHHCYRHVNFNTVNNLGAYKFIPFRVLHDARNPFGFFINHKNCGNVAFITDVKKCFTKFENLDYIIVEANYCDIIIEKNVRSNVIKPFLHNRIINSHMSINETVEWILTNDLKNVKKIFLIHLSDKNSNAEEFVAKVKKATGIECIAPESGSFEINKNPF